MEAKKYSVFGVQCSVLMAVNAAGAICAAELKVDLNPPDRRGEALTPHWENWACKEETVLSNRFGNVIVTFRAGEGARIVPVLYKGALDYGAHMAADGIALRNLSGQKAAPKLQMIIKGLEPGKHRIVTYHNELADREPTPLTITAGSAIKVEGLVPTKRATNDYEVASARFEIESAPGRDVEIGFEQSKVQSPKSLARRQRSQHLNEDEKEKTLAVWSLMGLR